MMIGTSTKRRGKCPRAKQQKMIADDTTDEEEEEEEGKWVKHYSSLHEILLVGEGDFSFSLCLANAFGSASNIVTTSLDNYGNECFLMFFFFFHLHGVEMSFLFFFYSPFLPY